MRRRRRWLGVVIVLALIVATRAFLLWNSHGGVLALIAGQQRDYWHRPDAAISETGGTAAPYAVRVTVDLSRVTSEVAPEYLSVAIDASQVTGGKWWDPVGRRHESGTGTVRAPLYDFNRPKLDSLVAALGPAYLRIGGSESDKVFYDLQPATSGARRPPAGYESVLSVEEWNALNGFATRHGLKVVFTLNVGPSSRDERGEWNPANAAALMRHAAARHDPVSAWELGNEVNNFWFVFGVRRRISTAQYHRDVLQARALVDSLMPSSKLVGQGSLFWPVLGEPLSLLFGFMPQYLKASGGLIDQVSWHYYPQQSRRGQVASRRAAPTRLLDPANLDEAGHWAKQVAGWRDEFAPGKPVWLGETGNAQFGGEPGLSDVYLADLWWLDELGLMARAGTEVVVRQTLSGMNYGMIDDATLAPRPDYWASLLWKRLMGPRVHATAVTGEGGDRLRAYAQSGVDGATCLLLINLDPTRSAMVEMPQLAQRDYTIHAVTTPDVYGQTVLLNGRALKVTLGGQVPPTPGIRTGGITGSTIELHPLSYTFVSTVIR